MSTKIKSIHALQVLDSRGNPTVSVRVQLEDGSVGLSSVPSGASTGEHEAIELRDGDAGCYRGKGVLNAVRNVSLIAEEIRGFDAENQAGLDNKLIALDGTPSKGKLGANAILGVSLASQRAFAQSRGLELFQSLSMNKKAGNLLPVPLVNVINGGAHANNSLDIQEFMLVPHGFSRFSDAIRASAETFHELGSLLKDDGYDTGVGDEGGYAPRLESTELAFDFLLRAIERAGYKPGEQISLALDVAASEMLIEGGIGGALYRFTKGSGEKYNSKELSDLYAEWVSTYPIVSIEDGLGENDWNGWEYLTQKLGDKIQIVGDDLFVTNVEMLNRGIRDGVANSILIKLNQIGSLTETLNAISLAHGNSYTAVISHRSGETADTTISDLAVATNAGQIKTGSMCRGERIEKYNRLLWIENILGDSAEYRSPFAR
ncbi:MAG TPA: phosphopyruvate hydratase [Oligoflexia bacterium]|nr:phosphopyruvate hydratase [Oligoflexia bacterium]HMP49629.1 phosphopyruvate hydratase [Oligoflexia bacterium]